MGFWINLILQADPTNLVMFGALLVLSLMWLLQLVETEKPEFGTKLPFGPDLDILIVGQPGHGMSATAKSIIGHTRFDSTRCGVFQSEEDGRKLFVVDTPGLDLNISPTDMESRKKAENDFGTAISLSPDGFHAILLVLAFGQQVAHKEVEAINRMKELLGENSIKDHGVLLVTCGDDFLQKMKGKKHFKSWCEEQRGPMARLLEECQNRCLLFNNEGDERILKEQRVELVKIIDGMTNGKRYNEGIVKQIQEGWLDVGNDHLRATYNDVSRIYLSMVRLAGKTKTPNQTFIDQMRHRTEELEAVTNGLTEGIKRRMKGKTREAHYELKRLEDAINCGDVSTVFSRSHMEDFLGPIDRSRHILFEELMGPVEMIANRLKNTWGVRFDPKRRFCVVL